MSVSPGSVPAKSAEVSGSGDAEVNAEERLVTGSEPIAVAAADSESGFPPGEQLQRDGIADPPPGAASWHASAVSDEAKPAVPREEDADPEAGEALASESMELGDESLEEVAAIASVREPGSEITEESSAAAAEAAIPTPESADGLANDLAEETATESVAGTAAETAGAEGAMVAAEPGFETTSAEPDEEIEDVSGLIIEGEALSPEAVAALETASGLIENRTVIEGSAAVPAAPTDDDFLRRVVLPAAPPPFPPDIMTSASGAQPATTMSAEESQDRTVISQPPSPEMLAALAAPHRATTMPAPFGSFAPEARGGVRLSVLQLGVLLLAAAAGGGGLVAWLQPQLAGARRADVAPAAVQPTAASAAPVAPKIEALPARAEPATPAPAAAVPPAAATASAPEVAAPKGAAAATTPAAAGAAPARAASHRSGPATARPGRIGGVGRRTTSMAKRSGGAARKPKKAFVDPFE